MSTLSPDQWRVLSPYLDQVLAMTDDSRAAWLSSLGEQDPALAGQLATLLDEHKVLAGEGFLENRRFAMPASSAWRSCFCTWEQPLPGDRLLCAISALWLRLRLMCSGKLGSCPPS